MITKDSETQTLPAVPIAPGPSGVPQKNPDSTKVCIIDCQYGGKTTAAARAAGHVNCSICFHAYHKDCVNVPTDVISSWPCPSCRHVATDVRSLHAKIDSLITQNADLAAVLSQQQDIIKSLKSLDEKVATLSCKLLPDADDSSDEDEDPEDVHPEGDLVIGDSLLRDVLSTDNNLTIDSTGGATLNAIRKKLKAINPAKRKYERIFIVAGTNDTATKRPPAKIATDCRALITTAKNLASSVTLSSIPPRADNRAEKSKIDNVNQLFLTIANEEGVCFVNHDNNFLFRDDTVDSSLLLLDQLHLSTNGVSKLIANLGLSSKSKPRIYHKPPSQSNGQTWAAVSTANLAPPPLMSLRPSPSHATSPPTATPANPLYFKGSNSPLSNFFPTRLTVWNMTFKSSEHAYQHKKCVTVGNNSAAANVLQAETPLEAKNIGNSVQSNDNWKDIRQGVMYQILKLKSRQCPQFHQFLLQSCDRQLVEDTTHPYWGRGHQGNGLNMLGKLLMMLRSELSTTSTLPRNFTPHPMVSPPRNFHGHTQPRSKQQQLRCFNCGEASHNLNTCRHHAQLRCYACHGLGHKQKFCTRG